MERTSMWNPFANMGELSGRALTIVGGSGSTVYDADGRAYLDAIASLWYANVGYGRAELADAAASQMRQLAAFQTFEFYSNAPAEALAERIAAIAPVRGGKVFFTSGGGSDAIDTAGKLARAYWAAVGRPGKQVAIGRANAYHGMNAYGTSLGGISANVNPFEPLVTLVEHVAWDDAAALAEAIDRIGPDRVAAFFCEPVVGAGGVLLPPEGYLNEVRRVCRERDVLFVADEVVTGFGRLGAWFASERFDLAPDLITCAKGLTSGYLPLGAVVVDERVAEPFWAPGTTNLFRHGYTYSGHPTACAVGLANLDIIEREGLLERVRELEATLEKSVRSLETHPLVSEVRAGLGLLAAVEVREDARAADPSIVGRLVREARARGVITRGLAGRALQVSPPFVISDEEIDRVVEVFGGALDAVG